MKKLSTLLILPLVLLAQPKARVQRTVVCTGAGTATAATCTPSPALAALSDLSTTPRTLVSFTPTANSTGALTLAINGLTATAVVKYVGGAAQALAADDLRAGTSYLLEYDGSAFVVKSVLGNGGGGGGGSLITRTPVTFSATPTFTRSSAIQQWSMTLTANVTGSTLSGASAGDLLSFEFTQDSTPRTVTMPTGFPALALCATSGSVTVAQYFWTGSAAIERSVSSPGCTERIIRWSDGTTTTFPAGSDTVVTLAGTQTLTNKTLTSPVLSNGTNGHCVQKNSSTGVLETSGAACGGGGGGGASLTAGYCYLSTNCAPPTASLAAITPGAVASRVYVVQIVPPFTMTITQLAARAGGGGGAGDGFAIGVYADSSNAPGTLIDDCAFADVSSGGAWKTCTPSIALTAGTPVWLAVAVENTAMSVRGYTGSFSAAFTEFNALLTPSRIGYCANAATGTGTGLALPLSCGSLTSASWAVPMIVATP